MYFLSGNDKMSRLIREKNWGDSVLGEPKNWPQQLKTACSIMLNSRFPMIIWWGKDLLFLYNDAYISTLGIKHPEVLGKPGKEVWSEIWDNIGPLLTGVQKNGIATWSENERLILERSGYPEETFHTFSYSPIYDEKGLVVGVFTAVSETTNSVLTARQLSILKDFSQEIAETNTPEELFKSAIDVIKANPHDFPFAIVYKQEEDTINYEFGTHDFSHIQFVEVSLSHNHRTEHKEIEVQHLQESVIEKITSIVDGQLSPSILRLTFINTGFNNKIIMIIGLNPYRSLDELYFNLFEQMADLIKINLIKINEITDERKRAEALAEIDRSKTTFFTNISHEFRTPLTLILGQSEELLISNDNDPEKTKGTLSSIHRNSMRLLKLVNTLLDFSRIEARRTTVHYSPVQLCLFTKELSSSFRSIIENAGLKYEVNCIDLNEEVYVDPEMWEKIVLNLLSNAFKYTLKGSISVNISREDQQAVLEVKDTGVGIGESELANIFKRFYKNTHSQGRSFEGTGIGLSLVHELVTIMHGTITVESQLGKGSAFTVKIPLGTEHIPKKQLQASKGRYADISQMYLKEAISLSGNEKTAEKESDKQTEGTILIVEDNADMRAYITSLLSPYYQIFTAVNGMDAFEKTTKNPPDLILSDVMMPVMNGIELLNKVKTNPATASIPFILLTARAGEESKIEGYELGADDYLIKPFSAQELIARIKAQLRLARYRAHIFEQQRNLFIQAPIAIAIVKGKDHCFELMNERMQEMFQKKETDVLYKPAFEIFPEAVSQGFMEYMNKAYSRGERIILNEVPLLQDQNGKQVLFYLKIIYEPIREEDGKISGLMAMADDITEVVLARKRIEDSEKHYRELISESPMAIAILEGPEMEVEFANKTILKTWNKHNKEKFFPILTQLFRKNFSRELSYVYTSGNHYYGHEIKLKLKTENGIRDVYYNLVFQPHRDLDENITGVVILANEVTPEALIKENIIKSEKELQQLSNAMPQLVWIANQQGEIYYYNNRIEEYYKTQISDGSKWEAIIHPEDLDETRQKWKDARINKSPYETEHRLKMSDESYKWHLTRAFPHLNENGEVIKWFGTATNIDALKRSEVKLKEAERKLKKAAKELEKRIEERTAELSQSNIMLKRINYELEQFAFITSHDLQEPLRKIRVFSNLIMDDEELSEQNKAYLQKIDTSANRMSELIKALLIYSKLERPHENFTKVDLNKVLSTTLENLEVHIQEKKAIIESDNIPQIKADPVQMQQLFTNLIENALKFSNPPTVIKVKAAIVGPQSLAVENVNLLSSHYLQLDFEDNGIGFDQKFVPLIFTIFQRLHPSEYKGTGIGLAICKKIVDNHHGYIKVKSTINKGTVISVFLPVVTPGD